MKKPKRGRHPIPRLKKPRKPLAAPAWLDSEDGPEEQRAAAAGEAEFVGLQRVSDFDKEWWRSFCWNFADYEFESGGVTDGVHHIIRGNWVVLTSGEHQVIVAAIPVLEREPPIDLYASSPEAVQTIQAKAGYPEFAWVPEDDRPLKPRGNAPRDRPLPGSHFP